MPVPKCPCQIRFTMTRAVSGFWREASHSARALRRRGMKGPSEGSLSSGPEPKTAGIAGETFAPFPMESPRGRMYDSGTGSVCTRMLALSYMTGVLTYDKASILVHTDPVPEC